jgi:hypothetical protein
MQEILKNVKDTVIHVLKTLNKNDHMEILANMVSKERDELISYTKQEFVKLDPERLNLGVLKEFIQNIRKFIHMFYAKFIDIDSYIEKLQNTPSTNVISVLECCRESKTKGKTVEE